jgi:hypothetical protein
MAFLFKGDENVTQVPYRGYWKATERHGVLKLTHQLPCMLLVQVAAATGGTSSGGGNGYSNRNNPWFLENTAEVRYCIDIDEEAMGVSAARAAQLVQEALQYWKTSFAQAATKEYLDGEIVPYGQLRVATQSFVHVPCSEATPLRFQLGTLADKEQAALVGEGHDLIGLAMRTRYDNVNLRGSGFVFITPQTGPLRTRAVGFSSEAWSVCDGCLLLLALKHELGHVFGVSHAGDHETSHNLMAHHFLAEVTGADNVDLIQRTRGLGDYFRLTFGRPYFSLEETRPLVTEVSREWNAARVLGLTEDDSWIQVRRAQGRDSWHEMLIERFVPDEGGHSSVEVLARTCPLSPSQFVRSRTPVNLIHLPSEQRVFTRLPDGSGRGSPRGMFFVSHLLSKDSEYSAVLCTTRAEAATDRLSIHLVSASAGSRMTAFIGDRIEPNFLQDFTGSRFMYLLPRRRSEETAPSKPTPVQPPAERHK